MIKRANGECGKLGSGRERRYTAQDPAGHSWTFSESVADMLPEDWGGTSENL